MTITARPRCALRIASMRSVLRRATVSESSLFAAAVADAAPDQLVHLHWARIDDALTAAAATSGCSSRLTAHRHRARSDLAMFTAQLPTAVRHLDLAVATAAGAAIEAVLLHDVLSETCPALAEEAARPWHTIFGATTWLRPDSPKRVRGSTLLHPRQRQANLEAQRPQEEGHHRYEQHRDPAPQRPRRQLRPIN